MRKNKRTARLRRKRRVRLNVRGTPDKPRLTVYRSLKHIYAQVVDDHSGKTLAVVSTLSKELRDDVAKLKKREAAAKVGQAIAERCKKQNVTQVVFDRNGYNYHGRVSALADGARKSGLKF